MTEDSLIRMTTFSSFVRELEEKENRNENGESLSCTSLYYQAGRKFIFFISHEIQFICLSHSFHSILILMYIDSSPSESLSTPVIIRSSIANPSDRPPSSDGKRAAGRKKAYRSSLYVERSTYKPVPENRRSLYLFNIFQPSVKRAPSNEVD